MATTKITQRIAITGLGLIGPGGVGREILWNKITDGGIAFVPCQRYASPLLCAEAPKPELRKLLRSSRYDRAPLISQYALLAMHEALLEAQMQPGKTLDGARIALAYGTSNGAGHATQAIYDDLLAQGSVAVKPRDFQESVFNAPMSLASIHFKITGPQLVMPMGEAAGASALLHAQILLAQDNIEAVIAVCADELCEAIQSALHQVRWHSPNNDREPGAFPFDRCHNGAVMAEGAVALVLERMDHAQSRAAPILAELAGVGCATDAHRLAHNAEDGRGLLTAMRSGFSDAQISPQEVDLICCGSACTEEDETLELAALNTLFTNRLPAMTSSKGAIGYPMGVAMFFDLALAIKAMQCKVIPPTVGLRSPAYDPCALSCETRTISDLNTVLCNGIGINGLYGAILIKSPQDG